MHAYLWDRYYGVCLAKYQHADVVNSVAFNPRDNEMLVTTSDDYEIRVRTLHSVWVYAADETNTNDRRFTHSQIWRSLSKAKKLGIPIVNRASEFRKQKSNRPPPPQQQQHQHCMRSFV